MGEDDEEEEEDKSNDEARDLSNGHYLCKQSFEDTNDRLKEVSVGQGADTTEQVEAEGKLTYKEICVVSFDKEIEKVKVLVPPGDRGKGPVICTRDNGEKVDSTGSEGTRVVCSLRIGGATSEGKEGPAGKGKKREE